VFTQHIAFAFTCAWNYTISGWSCQQGDPLWGEPPLNADGVYGDYAACQLGCQRGMSTCGEDWTSPLTQECLQCRQTCIPVAATTACALETPGSCPYPCHCQ
jgi:hypothetical protein